MTDSTEAEARLGAYNAAEHMALMDADCSPSLATLNAYAEAVRATERAKVRGLLSTCLDVLVDYDLAHGDLARDLRLWLDEEARS